MLAEKELGRGLPFGMYVPLYTLSVVVICGSFVKGMVRHSSWRPN